ncbi:PAS domain S-box protein [Oxynema aestuarii]|uniref:histidine kinase n=1 Tax=Oxynema aestuarii AP17 TaxID=2064643 RepID=A0A6H1U046_9CYAN|nr:PAS domain S-box protein [Oxynema aestuarii]QIZ71393.1 PAS domain S-box protein [Oxynema aestuarii AP17]
MSRILLWVENAEIRQVLVRELAGNWEIVSASSSTEVEFLATENPVDLCILDGEIFQANDAEEEVRARGQFLDRLRILLILNPDQLDLLDLTRDDEHRRRDDNRLHWDDLLIAPIQPQELRYRVDRLSSKRAKYPDAEIGVSTHSIAHRRLEPTPPSLGENSDRTTDELFRLLVEGIRDYGIFLLDATGKVTSWNKGAERIFGYRSEEIIGVHFSCFSPPEDIATGKPQQELQMVATAGQCEDEGWRVRAGGQCFWASMTISALHDEAGQLVGFSAIAHDLSDRQAVEMELCSLTRALRTLYDCNQAIARAESEPQLLQDICRIIVETGGYRRAWVALVPPHADASSSPEETRADNPLSPLTMVVHRAYETATEPGEPEPDFPENWRELHEIVLGRGQAQIVQNIGADRSGEPWRSAAIARGVHSTIALPLQGEQTTFGVLRIYADRPDVFTPEEVERLQELADDLAYGIVALRNWQSRRLAEAALTQSERRYRQLVELLPEAIFVQTEGQIEFINTTGAQLLGSGDPQEWLGRSLFDAIAEQDARDIEERIERAIREKHALPFVEQTLHALDGTEIAVELALSPIAEDPTGVSVLTVVRDLRDRKQMEAALRKSEQIHRITLSNISEAVFATDDAGRFTYICPNINFIFEYSVEEVHQLGHINALLGERWCEEQQLLDRQGSAADDDLDWHNIEWEILDKRGRSKTLLISVRQVEIEGGTLLYTCRNITERKQAEQALRESENRFRTTFEGAPIGMKLVDLEGRFLQTNPALDAMLGYQASDLKGMNFVQIVHPDDLEISLKLYRDLLHGDREHYQIEKRYLRADGRIVWVRASFSLIRDSQQQPQFAIAMVEDITERKQAEKELQIHRHHLEELVEERTGELRRTNEQLQEEIRRREQAQEALIRVTEAVESTSDAIGMSDTSGRSIYHNRAFLELFGYSVEQLNHAGGPTVLFADPKVGARVFESIRRGESWSGEVKMRTRCQRRPLGSQSPARYSFGATPRTLGHGTSPLLERDTVSIWLRVDTVRDERGKRVGSICVYTDITERKAAEEALRESEEQLRILIDAMPDLVCFKNDRGAWLEANRAMLETFQLSDRDYRGKTDAELAQISPFYRHSLFTCQQSDERAWQHRGLIHIEEAIALPDGREGIFDAIKVPLFHPDGTRKAVAIIARDITERKQAEEKLIRLASIVESSDDAIVGKTLDGTILSWNAGACRIYGYSAEEVKGRSISILVLPKRLASELRMLKRIQQGGSIDHYETIHVRKDGKPIHVSLTISPIKDTTGKITGVSTIARDITDLKRVEEALERLRHQNELILNSAGEGICGVDRQGRTTFINPAASRMLGYPMGELLGAPLAKILAPLPGENGSEEGSPPIHSPIYAALKDGSVHHGTDEVFWRKDGSSFPVEYMSTPIQEQSQIVGAVVTFKDITERQAIERMKDEFISVVSHELRTPLTSIRGSLGLLQGGLLESQPSKARRMLEIAVSNTDRLVRLINDILDLERIQSGKVSMLHQSCNVAELMVQAVDAMRAIAEKAQVHLFVEPLSLHMQADPDRVVQTLTNLLSNAIKFSPEGESVWLSAQVSNALPRETADGEGDRTAASVGDRRREVLFQVRDRGRGIPADKLETIFERFQQVDASDSRKKGGTGLGLAICRSIVEHHGGRIWAESEPGRGSCFSFTLPLDRPTLNEAPPSSPLLSTEVSPPSPPLILVADRHEESRHRLVAWLERAGYRAIAAHSSLEVVELASSLAIESIFLNLDPSDMNAWQTIAHLKNNPKTRDIPVTLVTDLSCVREAAGLSEMKGWICKPLQESLRPVTAAIAEPESQNRERGDDAKARVLIVEDDPDLAQVLVATFKRHGIETFHARTGREAIQISQHVIPDLLVLDLVLPEYDGFAVVDWFRQHDRFARMPLVVYSARTLDRNEREQLKLGETEFLTKSTNSPDEFERRAIALLERMVKTDRS